MCHYDPACDLPDTEVGTGWFGDWWQCMTTPVWGASWRKSIPSCVFGLRDALALSGYYLAASRHVPGAPWWEPGFRTGILHPSPWFSLSWMLLACFLPGSLSLHPLWPGLDGREKQGSWGWSFGSLLSFIRAVYSSPIPELPMVPWNYWLNLFLGMITQKNQV